MQASLREEQTKTRLHLRVTCAWLLSCPHDGKDQVFLDEWVKITNSQKALNIVLGYKPRFLAEPFQSFLPKSFVRNQQEAKIIQEEINALLEKEAIEPIPHNQAKFVSNFLLVKKKSDGFRLVINLKSQFSHTEHFTMETITNLRTMLSKDHWIVTIDISLAYITIHLDEEFKDYVAFQYRDQAYRFLCMPFGLNNAARAFTKMMKHPAAKVRALGSSTFRRLDSSCPNKAFISKAISIFSKFSLEARLQNKLRKIQSGSI